MVAPANLPLKRQVRFRSNKEARPQAASRPRTCSGQEKQSGRTPWRAASLCAERKALWGNAPMCLKRGLSAKQKRINTKYGLDIHYYRSAAAGGRVAVL